jgi:hypothetical protein
MLVAERLDIPPTFPPLLPINIDGEGADWQSYLPAVVDPQGDATGGLHTDLRAAYAETGPNYAYLMVEPYDLPLVSEGMVVLHMNLESSDGAVRELMINVHSDGSVGTFFDVDGDGVLATYPVPGTLVAWGNVMEVRFPLWPLWNPVRVQPFYGALWSTVDGEWTLVDHLWY